jgi:type III restriction enzyme
MKLKFKKQDYQGEAVAAVVDCFVGQPKQAGVKYKVDPGQSKGHDARQDELGIDYGETGFKNHELRLSRQQLLENIRAVQHRQNLPLSESVVSSKVCPVNLDIEMETGTGKTYCYIKTMFELNKRYGWSKFIVMVPSVAIREGVAKSFELTADHFMEEYGKQARPFIYDSKQLHKVESFSSDGGINVMIINSQAFAARGKDARRIYEELDDFQSRRPIDVIQANHPILILDEPQKLEGKATFESMAKFNPLAILRYSATHKKEHNKIHRLDALDAYNQKLVKKISVRGISVRGLSGTNAYLFLESIQTSPNRPPVARLEFEVRQKSGIKRVLRQCQKGDKLYELSGNLDEYQGFVISEIDAVTYTLHFTNGEMMQLGEASGDVNEATLRRLQIREAINAHLDKEQSLFYQGIKVLSLFFIDEVAKYRCYDDADDTRGEYARIFEEEYNRALNDRLELENTPYQQYLKGIKTGTTHNGYFSIDKKSKQLIDPKVKGRGEEKQADDVDAYDLILKDKERLLSLNEPVRFIFSHSALSEGWDNPNVFVICTLKHSDSSIRKRQEVGRGLRLCVNQQGDRMDSGPAVHQTNVLTVVASESYKDFTAGLQKEIGESLSARPRHASIDYFTGKILRTSQGDVPVTSPMARQLYHYLAKHDYTDANDFITTAYQEAKEHDALAALPPDLEPYTPQVFKLIDSVFNPAELDEITQNDRKARCNPRNKNLERVEFKALWNKINRKAAYTVHFDTAELIDKCVRTLNEKLTVAQLTYTVERGDQCESVSYDEVKNGNLFSVMENQTRSAPISAHSSVQYDLIGKLSEDTQLTRATMATILKQLNPATFALYRINPENFIRNVGRLVKEQKATMIVEHISYHPVEERHQLDEIFTVKKHPDFSHAVKADKHVYDYVFWDSANEKDFVEQLDKSAEVVVYSKLPKGFYIPTPVGHYNPDWAIAFKEGVVQHVYFIAETKGAMSTMELREIEECKIKCARRFFKGITSDQVKYDVVDSYGKLMDIVGTAQFA